MAGATCSLTIDGAFEAFGAFGAFQAFDFHYIEIQVVSI